MKSEIIAALLILLFAYTAFQKFIGHGTFLNTLHNSALLRPVAIFVSWSVPITELAIVCLLLFPLLRKIGLLCSAVLLTVFTIYIVCMLLFSSSLPCTCGGIISSLSWKQHILFNIIFIGLALYGWYSMRETSDTNNNIAIRRSQTPVT
ncbi:MauE/DoxX family redox-associated membrane protein [Pinibacter soli]|uniref:MauE/DoxX family redox-associated membrane protein n=1 Tax=Pinibacter soli TaxID=3044211 RepID=A0ABT6RFN2_9BACT|nr:MauE/DoxX family redox-associated membrane protein [Pinibacter soli]MDI3321372.1 MauE/DoxX family redox-associated membrane protein [Pinibacter soli]